MAFSTFNTSSREVASLLDILDEAIKTGNLSEESHFSVLERLKVLGRNPEDAEPIFTTRGIGILGAIGFDFGPPPVSREALRCLANALLLRPSTRQLLVNLNYGRKAAVKLQTERNDDEFICSRIVFLLTYETDLDFEELVLKYNLAEAINKNVIRHAETATPLRTHSAAKRRSVEAEMALSESLKLLFNLMHNRPLLEPYFVPCLPSMITILLNEISFSQLPLESPINHLINALLNFDPSHQAVFPDAEPAKIVQALTNILDTSTIRYPETSLGVLIAPLLTLIRRLYEAAPEDVKTCMRNLLLPSHEDRNEAIGKSNSLSSRLIFLSSSPHMASTGESISSLIFELSDKDVDRFVYNIGYGNASGFLANQTIHVSRPVSLNDSAPGHDSASGSAGEAASTGVTPSRGINYVTGQYLDREPVIVQTPLTEDEQMREAERLFVLFERLQKTGVVNVENPVRTAIETGRFEEID